MKESEVPVKYYNRKTKTHTYVNYYLLNEGRNFVCDKLTNAICFSAITYNSIPPETKQIVVFHGLKKVPYDLQFIEKWINEINLLGFPCELAAEKDSPQFKVCINLSDCKKKLHVNVTLQLIRYLTESYICYYPDLYFQKVEKLEIESGGPISVDRKFEILQEIHKIRVFSDNEYYQANINHTITNSGNFVKPLSRADFFKRVEELTVGVYGKHDITYGVNWLWRNNSLLK